MDNLLNWWNEKIDAESGSHKTPSIGLGGKDDPITGMSYKLPFSMNKSNLTNIINSERENHAKSIWSIIEPIAASLGELGYPMPKNVHELQSAMGARPDFAIVISILATTLNVQSSLYERVYNTPSELIGKKR